MKCFRRKIRFTFDTYMGALAKQRDKYEKAAAAKNYSELVRIAHNTVLISERLYRRVA